MTYIHSVRPFYIDNELQLKKLKYFQKRPPRGALCHEALGNSETKEP